MPIKPSTDPICHAIQRYIEETKTPSYLHANPGGSLEDTFQCGCKLCEVALSVLGIQGGRKNPKWGTGIVASISGSGIRFSAAIPAPSTEIFIQEITNVPPYDVIPVSASIPTSTSPEATVHKVAEWLKNCLLNHAPLCPGPPTRSTVSTLPARVLHVGTSQKPHVRLVTPTPGEKGLYICLSHCWGGHQPLQTTLNPDTLTKFHSQIGWEVLPRTFQDAVLYTRALELEYLWIDSLCIIQDSPEDWQVQSQAMASIYQNAILTLAATASAGPHEGLFHSTNPAHTSKPLRTAPETQKDARTETSLGEATHSRAAQAQVELYTRTPLPHLQSPHPLLKRAWVLQERLLSPRILHFLTDELVWECMGALQCACGGIWANRSAALPAYSPLIPVFRSNTQGMYPAWVFRKMRIHGPSFEAMDGNAVTDAWHRLVEEYTGMGLSYPADVFPAVAGVARVVREGGGGAQGKRVYVAGLWRDSLVFDLLWGSSGRVGMERASVWRAPSFSWASVVPKRGCKASISYIHDHRWMKDDKHPDTKVRVLAEVVDTKVEPVRGGDELGRLVSGYIILRGMLIAARITHMEQERWDLNSLEKEMWDGDFQADFDIGKDLLDGPQKATKQKGEVRVHCLALAQKVRFYYERTIWLVLRVKHETEEGRLFERIGLYQDSEDPKIGLELESNEADIDRDATVKII